MKAQNEDNNPPKNRLKTIFLVNAIGIDFVVCVLAGFYLGSYVRNLTGEVLWIVPGVLAGVGAGTWTVILIIKRYMGGSDE